jgi:hypothetical protein
MQAELAARFYGLRLTALWVEDGSPRLRVEQALGKKGYSGGHRDGAVAPVSQRGEASVPTLQGAK